MSDRMLEVTNLSYTYPGAPGPALAGVTVRVEPGEFVVVAGGSGSGKSTLLRLASGLVPHFHGGEVSGEALVGGSSVRHHGPAELASTVGTLLQDPETQVLMTTVRAELAFPLENRGFTPAAIARGVEEAALALGIAPLLGRPTAELSGGELQRVALGAALAGRPRLLCLDEPTSQLDPVAGDELLSLLRRLNEDTDVAILLAEHRLERCLPFADRVLVLDGGRIVCDADPPGFLSWATTAAPALLTPGALLLGQLGLRPVAGVRAARTALRREGLLPAAASDAGAASPGEARPASFQPKRWRKWIGRGGENPALRYDRVWHELPGGAQVLRDVSLQIAPGERVAVMGRNGAGKSTLLRHGAGLMKPTRGRVEVGGRVALLPQSPTDLLVHETVAQEAPEAARAQVGLAGGGWDQRHPRELSGGERQRLALAVILDPAPAGQPAVVLLDEPTRGMDRAHRQELSDLLDRLEAAVVIATHDPEFAAMCAARVILLADGAVIADGPASEVLSGGAYFSTETARILGGHGGALLAGEGAALLRPVVHAEVRA